MMRPDRSTLRQAASGQARRRFRGISGGFVLLVAVGWWSWALARWSQRIRPGWESVMTCIGTHTAANPGTGRFAESDTPAVYQHVLRATEPGEERGSVIVEERWVQWNIATGEQQLQASSHALVSARRATRLEPGKEGGAFLFPRHVKPTAYTLQTGYLKGLTVSFQARERLEGLETLRFGYEGPAEYSDAYAGDAGHPGIRPAAGQQIRCRDDSFAIGLWVEPTTGELVKLVEGCSSGDYLYDTATDLPVGPVARWSGSSAGDEMLERIERIRRERRDYQWNVQAIPALLVLVGLVIAAGTLPRREVSARVQLGGVS